MTRQVVPAPWALAREGSWQAGLPRPASRRSTDLSRVQLDGMSEDQIAFVREMVSAALVGRAGNLRTLNAPTARHSLRVLGTNPSAAYWWIKVLVSCGPKP